MPCFYINPSQSQFFASRRKHFIQFPASVGACILCLRSMTVENNFRFTGGLLVMVPMPDFSMPFNVIALGITVLTLFFGSMFK